MSRLEDAYECVFKAVLVNDIELWVMRRCSDDKGAPLRITFFGPPSTGKFIDLDVLVEDFDVRVAVQRSVGRPARLSPISPDDVLNALRAPPPPPGGK